MQVKINGKQEDVNVKNVLELLKVRNVEPEMVSVELNSQILDRKDYAATSIKDGDIIEFLYFMGGGVAKEAV
jgi:sulfur carrier protein